MQPLQMTFHSSKKADTSDKDFNVTYSTIIQIQCPVDTKKLWCHLRDCGKFVSDLNFLTHLLNLQKLWETGCLKVASTFDDNQECSAGCLIDDGKSNMNQNQESNNTDYAYPEDFAYQGTMGDTYAEERNQEDSDDVVKTESSDETREDKLTYNVKNYAEVSEAQFYAEEKRELSTNGRYWNLRPRSAGLSLKYRDNLSDSSDFGDDAPTATEDEAEHHQSHVVDVDPSLLVQTEIDSTPRGFAASQSSTHPSSSSLALQTAEEYEESEMRKRPLRKRLKKIVQSEEEEKPCRAEESEKEITPMTAQVMVKREPVDVDDAAITSVNDVATKKQRKRWSTSPSSSGKHTFPEGGNREIKCPICPTAFPLKKQLAAHLESDHAPAMAGEGRGDDENAGISCVVCKSMVKTQRELVRHLQTHAERAYTCDRCSLRFSNRHRLNVHQYEHLTEAAKEDFRCDVCGKPCYSKCYLQRHRRRHTGERPYMCDVCGKVYFEMSTLNTHRRSHTDERFACALCGNRYMQKSALNLHMKSAHEGIKEHMCEVCGKAFFDKHHLQKHIRVHTGEKPYQCDFCGKSFTQKVNRDQHRRLHTGEQPYRCEYCFRMFALRAAYTQHVRKHTGVKVSELKRVQLEQLQNELSKKQQQEQHSQQQQAPQSSSYDDEEDEEDDDTKGLDLSGCSAVKE